MLTNEPQMHYHVRKLAVVSAVVTMDDAEAMFSEIFRKSL